MKAALIVEYAVILAGLAGAFITLLAGWQKYLTNNLDIAKQKEGRSDSIQRIEARLERIESEIDDVKKNEERYLNLLEKLANKYSQDK